MRRIFAVLAAFLVAACCRADVPLVQQSTTYTIPLHILAASDHVSGLTGATGNAYIVRINGAAGTVTKAASANTITEVDSVNSPGLYTLTITATEDGTLGYVDVYYKSASSDPLNVTFKVVAFNPDSATSMISGIQGVSPPANWNSMAITGGGAVTVGTNNDKTGYSLTQTFPTNFSNLSIDGSGRTLLQPTQTGVTIPTVTTLTNAPNDSSGVTTLLSRVGQSLSFDGSGYLKCDLLTYTPNTGSATTLGASFAFPNATVGTSTYAGADTAGTTTLLSRIPGTVQPQTGDSYARLGAPNGASIDADILTRMASGNVTIGGYAVNQDPQTLILGATAATWNTAGTIGAKINAVGTASDPWATALPGSYASGTAGNILGNNLNAAITSRMATFTLPTNFSSLLISSGGLVQWDLTEPVGSAPWNTTTAADVLKAAWVQGVGIWRISGSSLTLYAPDGTTPYKTFTISPTPTGNASRQ